MKIKLILATILLTVLGGLTLLQANSVNAQVLTNSGSIGPITGPLPSPNPISYFLIKGHVTHMIGGVKNPGVGVEVRALNLDSQEELGTTTDEEGKFRFSVQNGTYKVYPVSTCPTIANNSSCVTTSQVHFIYRPSFRNVVVNNHNVSGVGFKGFPF